PPPPPPLPYTTLFRSTPLTASLLKSSMSLTSTSACRCYASHYFAFLERSGVTFRVQPDRVSEQAFGNQGDVRRRFWPALLIGSRDRKSTRLNSSHVSI